MIASLQQIFMVAAIWSLLLTMFAGIFFVIMKDKYQHRNKKNKDECAKRKKAVRISGRVFLSVGILTAVLALAAIALKIILNMS